LLAKIRGEKTIVTRPGWPSHAARKKFGVNCNVAFLLVVSMLIEPLVVGAEMCCPVAAGVKTSRLDMKIKKHKREIIKRWQSFDSFL
jgi:hypothetical protein